VKTVRAAGGLIWRPDGSGRFQVALVHRPAYNDWSFPKGKLEEGETEAHAALREVAEETGLRPALGRDLGTTSYTDALGRPKTVRYWQMRADADADDLVPAHEIDDARWASFEDARELLSYPHDAELLERFKPPPGPGETVGVLIVRHAKAGNRSKWTAPDDERPLEDAGHRQAERLAVRLRDEPVGKLLSSPYLRCVQTVEPLAAERNLGIVISDALAEGSSPDDAVGLMLAEAAEGPAAVCTHGDVMMFAVERLLAAGVALADPEVDFKKGSVWKLEVRDSSFVSARYIRPPKA
jgi:8-oxo-dGTP diphosphatase